MRTLRILLFLTLLLPTFACDGSGKEGTGTALRATGSARGGELDSLIAQATELHSEKRYAEGIELLEQGLVSYPKSAELHYNLGVMRGSTNDHEGAARAFEQALTYDPEHLAAHRALGNAYTRLGQPERALPHLEHCLWKEPGDSACRWLLGHNLSGLGRFEEAAGHLEQAAKARQDANSWFELGLARRRLGDLEAAAEAFSMALAVDHLHLPSLLNYGQVLTALGREQDGEALLQTHQYLAKMFDRSETLERLADQDDSTPGVLLELADLHLAREDLGEAERSYRRALDRFGDVPPAALGLAALLLQQDRVDEAEELIGRVLASEPEGPAGLYLQGILELKLGRLAAATEAFERSREGFAWTSDLYIDLGGAYRDLGLLGPSEKAYREAIRMGPAHPMAELGLAKTLAAQGRPREAEFGVRKAIELEPALSEAWQLYGILRIQAGDSQGAAAAFLNSLATMRPRLLRAGAPAEIEQEFRASTDSTAAQELFQAVLASVTLASPAPAED